MGRAVPEKGFEDLLNALGMLREQHVPLPHLILAATGSSASPDSYQQKLAQLVDTNDLDATVLTRFDPAVRGWLSSPVLRAVVVPSREEPFGRIPLEAFAAHAGPVVATTAGGLAQTVVDGLTGLTAAPGDPESLAAAVERALKIQPGERERMLGAGTTLLAERHDYTAAIRAALRRCAPWALTTATRQQGAAR
nr:glycosyltransferase family 4 protein [Phytoactinopolyspora mesophila]